MASIVDPPPSVHHTRSEAIAGGKKKSDIEMYHAMQSTTNTKGMHNELHHENCCTFFLVSTPLESNGLDYSSEIFKIPTMESFKF